MPDQSFQTLIAKAEAINNKRIALEAERSSLVKRREELLASIVSQYGSDYLAKYEEMSRMVLAWGNSNA